MEKYNVIDSLLNGVGTKLQLDKTRRDRVETSYRGVSQWLAEDESIADDSLFDIYPQGSYKLETTVKPLKGNEYDLDFVLEVQKPWSQNMDAMAFLRQVYECLMRNDIYKDKTELKNRCVRVNYKDDFHMDILPSYPFNYVGNTNVKVPDRQTRYWKDSAPKGYAIWFEKSCEYLTILMEKAAKIEPLPEDTPFEMKPPLKRAVQLIKRYRDVYFQDDPDSAPISIVLTTLAAIYYNYNKQESVFLTIKSILEKLYYEIQTTDGIIEVHNPVNLDEKLSERWDNDITLYENFKEFIIDFRVQWLELEQTLGNGLHEIKAKLQDLFGETVAVEVLNEYAAFTTRHRTNSTLGLSSAGTLLSGINVQRKDSVANVSSNTFYGGKNKLY